MISRVYRYNVWRRTLSLSPGRPRQARGNNRKIRWQSELGIEEDDAGLWLPINISQSGFGNGEIDGSLRLSSSRFLPSGVGGPGRHLRRLVVADSDDSVNSDLNLGDDSCRRSLCFCVSFKWAQRGFELY